MAQLRAIWQCEIFDTTPEFIELEKWPRNNLDLYPVDHLMWGALQQISDTDWLKCMLIDCWTQLTQGTLF